MRCDEQCKSYDEASPYDAGGLRSNKHFRQSAPICDSGDQPTPPPRPLTSGRPFRFYEVNVHNFDCRFAKLLCYHTDRNAEFTRQESHDVHHPA